MRAVILVTVIASAGCLRSTQFQCATNADCGANGTCEAVKFCSFPDPACGGNRFSDTAGPYANQCTSNANMPDAGTGSGSDSGGGSDSGMTDAGSTGCPSGYDVVGTLPHKYKVIPGAQDWQTQVAACHATSVSAYLIIPDDATELMAIDALTTTPGTYWIGVGDAATEGTYLNIKNMPQMFLPWDTAAGEPNNGPPEEDCVDAHKANNFFYTDKCSIKMAAVCECEP